MADYSELTDLLARYAYSEGDYRLSSGGSSSFYLDVKQVTYLPEGVESVGKAVRELAHAFDAEAVGGLTMGADAIVSSTVWASRGSSRSMPGFVVRKEAKKHGLEKWIEGISPTGLRVAIVDDVVTSGQSVLKAVRAAQEAGATVTVVIALVDREEGGASVIEDAGVPFRAICTVSQVREASRRHGSAVA